MPCDQGESELLNSRPLLIRRALSRCDLLTVATITPRLKEIPLRQIMQAAGVAKTAASDYRRGKRVPHPSYWAALARLVGVEEDLCAQPA
jgi:hypothetical protein